MRKENEIRMESNRRLWGEGWAGTLPPPRGPKECGGDPGQQEGSRRHLHQEGPQAPLTPGIGKVPAATCSKESSICQTPPSPKRKTAQAQGGTTRPAGRA